MVEARREVERDQFEAVTRRLVGRAEAGRGRVSAVPSADAEDVVQDAWEKLVRQGAPLPRGQQLEAHAQQALVDTSTDYWRSRRRKKDVPPDRLIALDDAPQEQLGSDESEERRIAALRTREIYEAMTRIIDEQAVAYAVLDALGLDEKEIACELEISERDAGAARKRVSRARLAIAQAINHRPTTTKEDH